MSDFDSALADVGQSFQDDREVYVRSLLEGMRRSVVEFERTEEEIDRVHEEYQRGVTGRVDLLVARQRADSDSRVTSAIGNGTWYRDRAQTYALAYLVERDVDDRKARR